MDKIFYYFEDGHNKFKSVGDDVERHPLIQALVLSIIVSMVLFFLLALTTKTLGNPYEETVVAERIAPVHCRRYTLCSRRGANFIVGRFSGPTTSIRVNHQTYEILKRHSVRSLFITGHSGIFGSTVETYKISPTAK